MIITDFAQKDLVRKIKFFFKSKKITKLEYSRLGLFYLCPFATTKGNAKIYFFLNKIKYFKIYLKTTIIDFYNLLKIQDFKTVIHDEKKIKNYKSIVVNWGSLKDFNKAGEFHDKYFNINSSICNDVFWYIIYLDDKLPRKINKNIALVFSKKSKFSFLHFKKIIKNILYKKSKFKFINQEISYFSILALYVYRDFDRFIFKGLKKIIMPYEGQPFQNTIFFKISQMRKKINTFGYIHSFPIGLPTNLFKRAGNPNKLLINSISQKYALKKFFGWSNLDLKILPSARFKKYTNNEMNNKIFLPIEFSSSKKILKSFLELMKYKKSDFSLLEIKNHPRCFKSKKHLNLIADIKNMIKDYSKNKKIKSNFSVFIGPTGSVIEALERNLNVFHICENPVIETYTKEIWKYINCYRINDNLFKYKKIGEQRLLKFNNDKKIYRKYIY